MTLTTNIILWTMSFILASAGIIFGLFASINASRANKSIRELIATSWITQMAETQFFTNMKEAIISNKTVIKYLTTAESINYYDYSLKSSPSRLNPLSTRTIRDLDDTKFNELVKEFVQSKKEFDSTFSNIFPDFSVLRSRDIIQKDIIDQLVLYHTAVIEGANKILRWYLQIVDAKIESTDF